MPVVSPQGYVDPGAQKRDTVGAGIAEVFQGVVRGMQMGQQLAAQQQQMELAQQQAQRQELDFARNMALEDAAVSSTLDPLEPLGLGGALGTAATSRRQRPTQQAAAQAPQPFDRNAAAAGLDDAAFQKSAAQQQAAGSREDLSRSQDETFAAEAQNEAFGQMAQSRDSVNRHNAEIQRYFLEQSRAPGSTGDVVPGAEGPDRVPSPGHQPPVTAGGDRLDAAMQALGGTQMVGPSRQEMAGGDQFGAALLDEDSAKRRAEADAAHAASLSSGMQNPAIEFGAGPDAILEPSAVARAVLLYRKTGDPSIFAAFGGEVPEDLDGMVERVTAFRRAVDREQINAYTAKYLGVGAPDEAKAGDGMDYAAQFMGELTDDWQQAKLWGRQVQKMVDQNTDPAKAIGVVTAEARDKKKHGRFAVEEGLRKETATAPRTNISISSGRERETARKEADDARKLFDSIVRSGANMNTAAGREVTSRFNAAMASGKKADRMAAMDAMEAFAPSVTLMGEGAAGLRDLAGLDTAGDGSELPVVTDKADFDALPSDSLYREEPGGPVYRKP
jgi:hypothetical protein